MIEESRINTQALSPVVHQRQYVDFRVVVYRLLLTTPEGTDPDITIMGSTSIKLSEIFRLNFNDYRYQVITRLFDGSSSGPGILNDFELFLKNIYSALKNLLTNNGEPYTADQLIEKGVLQEIDITPLVDRIAIQTSLESVNQCTISMVDPQQADFSGIELDRYIRNVQAFSPNLSKTRSELLKELRTFAFSEFDFVRVFVSAPIEKTPTEQVLGLQKIFKDAGIQAPDSGRSVSEFQSYEDLGIRFSMLPGFTGVVASIRTTTAVGRVSNIDVTCIGMQRVLMQSVSIFSDAIAPVITRATPELGILSGEFTALSNVFTDMGVDAIMSKIIGSYFVPLFLSRKGDDIIGVPSLRAIFTKMYEVNMGSGFVGATQEDRPNLIPYLPTLIIYHLVKLKYREPIFSFDDRVGGFRDFVHRPEGGTIQISAEVAGLEDKMTAYLMMGRDTYANFDSSYVSPTEVFDIIRGTTYMEIFEDRTGQFHFRCPRYNLVNITKNIKLGETINTTVSSDDSSVYTANVAQRVIPFMGNTGAIDGRVYVDKFSIFRYGFRKPQTIENPNAVTESFAKELARFTRDYKAGREARTATITKIGDPKISPGELVIFRHGRLQRVGAKPNPISSGAVDVYVGYVMSVLDNISVGGIYTQTLELAFVREASLVGQSKNAFQSMDGTIWDAISNNATGVLRYHQNFLNSISEEVIKTGQDESAFLFNITIRPEFVYNASFRHVESAIELAIASYDPNVAKGEREYNSLVKGLKDPDAKPDQLQKLISAIDASIKTRKNELAVKFRISRILSKFIPHLNTAISATRSVAGTTTASEGSNKRTLINIGNRLDNAFNEVNESFSSEFTENIEYTVFGQKKSEEIVFISTHFSDMTWGRLIKEAAESRKNRFPGLEDAYTRIFVNPDIPYSSNDAEEGTNLLETVRDVVDVLVKGFPAEARRDNKITQYTTAKMDAEKKLGQAKATAKAKADQNVVKPQQAKTNLANPNMPTTDQDSVAQKSSQVDQNG